MLLLPRNRFPTGCGEVCGLELRDFMSLPLVRFYHAICGTWSR